MAKHFILIFAYYYLPACNKMDITPNKEGTNCYSTTTLKYDHKKNRKKAECVKIKCGANFLNDGY